MAARPLFVLAAALSGLGAALFFVPQVSDIVSAIFAVPLAAFWLFAWCLDARFTARNWQMVIEGKEANVLVLALSKIAPSRPALVLAVHAIFSLVAAAGLQALVTHSLDYLLMSCVLAIFGALHVEAFYRSRAFVRVHAGKQMR